MTALNVSEITQYSCNITNSAKHWIPLVQNKSEFFCYKVGAQKQVKLFQLMLRTAPPPHVVNY
jgi:hypothetical protein